MLRFIRVEIDNYFQVLSVSFMDRRLSSLPLRKTSSLVIIKSSGRAKVQKFCAIVPALAGHSSVQFMPKFSPTQSLSHLASLVFVPSLHSCYRERMLKRTLNVCC